MLIENNNKKVSFAAVNSIELKIGFIKDKKFVHLLDSH